MNILFVMKHRGNAGNIHAVADYMRVGERFGHGIALYGAPQPWLPALRFSNDAAAFDRVVYLFESEIYRLSRLQEVTLLGRHGRDERLILDMDGMYNPIIQIDQYDRNHSDEAQQREWIAYFDALADRVMKPTLQTPESPRAAALPFYGYDPALEMKSAAAPQKVFDIMHMGHNWWRWKQVSEELLPAFELIRDQVGEIGFIGLWWDAPPVEGPAAGPAEAFRSDPEAFRRLHIRTRPSVMYNEVIFTMSTARINIFTQRPVLHHLRHLTLKYFEIFYADTIPLLMLDPDHAATVYGPAGRELTLSADIAAKLLDALARPEHYRGLVADVRRHMAVYHSYERRIDELIAAIGP